MVRTCRVSNAVHELLLIRAEEHGLDPHELADAILAEALEQDTHLYAVIAKRFSLASEDTLAGD